MEFEQRLQKAISRGQEIRRVQGQAAAEEILSEEESRNLHSRLRLELAEIVETDLSQLAEHFPGFEFTSLVDAEGWGARIRRDDVNRLPGQPLAHYYSHLEMRVRPYSTLRLLELTARGAVRNKEILSRSHFQYLNQVDISTFRETIHQWSLEYAERYASQG